MSLMVRSPFSNTPRYHVSSSSGKTSAASDRAVRGCPRGEWRGWGEQGHSLLVDAFNPSIYCIFHIPTFYHFQFIFYLVSFDLICLFYLNRVESAPWRGHVWWSQRPMILVGGWAYPSEKYSSVGVIIPNIWKNNEKHIPKHQPVYESQCKASLDLQCSTALDHSSEVVVNVTCICTKLKTWVTLAIPGILNITTEDVNLNCQVNAPRPYWWLSGHGHCNPSLEYQPYHKSNYPLSSQACLF